MSRFLTGGGSVVRGTVQHLSQLVEREAGILAGGKLLSAPAAVVVCVGLGARTLGGVEDKDVYPIRGQTVLLKAPWIRFGRTISSRDGLWTYIIPRRSGEVWNIIRFAIFILTFFTGHCGRNKISERLV